LLGQGGARQSRTAKARAGGLQPLGFANTHTAP
jgi:hypothetical protein